MYISIQGSSRETHAIPHGMSRMSLILEEAWEAAEGGRVVVHSLMNTSASLNGALCLILESPDDVGLTSVRVCHPSSVCEAYPG
jgi:hypothetical protein